MRITSQSASNLAKTIAGVSKTLGIIDKVNEWAGAGVSYLSLALIASVTYEVVARYAFNAPTMWSLELGTFIFAGMWLFAGGYVLRHDAHIRVDLLYTRLSPRGKAIIDVITSPFFFLMVGLVLWTTWRFALISIAEHEISGSTWAPPLYIIRTFLPIGAFLLFIQGIAKLFRDLNVAFGLEQAASVPKTTRANIAGSLLVVITISGIIALVGLLILLEIRPLESFVSLSAGAIALLLFGVSFILMAAGLPIAFSMGGVAYAIIFLMKGSAGLGIIASRAWGIVDTFVLVALPMYVFMGVMLQQSGIANQLYSAMHKWAGGLRGGLAAGTVFICMLMAAMTGMSAAATLTMGVTALPEMLKRGYNKSLAIGCILAGGALGPLIPPSISMIFYSLVAEQSVGKLFMGGVVPGVLLGFLFILYSLVRSWIQPSLAPALPLAERASWPAKFISLRQVLLPVFIIFMVLGSIFFGVATPTEAAAIGALGTIISAAVNRSLDFKSIKGACLETMRICGMGIWIIVGTYVIQSIVFSAGTQQYIEQLFLKLPGGPIGVLVSIQIIWFILGCLLDPVSILLITGPIFVPIMANLGFDLIWFGVVFVVNMEMAYLTPPYGVNLFYMKGVVPKGITMGDVYRSITPFVICQAIGLVLVIAFPQLILWLPSKMIAS